MFNVCIVYTLLRDLLVHCCCCCCCPLIGIYCRTTLPPGWVFLLGRFGHLSSELLAKCYLMVIYPAMLLRQCKIQIQIYTVYTHCSSCFSSPRLKHISSPLNIVYMFCIYYLPIKPEPIGSSYHPAPPISRPDR